MNSIFHTAEFLEIFRGARTVDASSFLVTDERGEVGGFNMFAMSSMAGVPARFQSRCTIFSPPWMSDESEAREFYDEVLPQFSEEAHRNSLFAEWRMWENAEAHAGVFAKHGWKYIAYFNYLVHLDRDVEKVWMSFSQSTRRGIRKARENGVQVRSIQPGEEEKAYGMIRSLYDGKGIPLFDRSVFMNAFRVLVPRGMMRGTFAVVDGKIVGARLALLYNDVVFDWYAASDHGYSKLHPNETLAWDMMEFGALNGYRIFDFGGAGRKGEKYGPGKFKEKFRGELTEHGRFVRAFRPRIYDLVRFLYRERLQVAQWKR